jgi:2-methylisocitrate lyase-like PEP mutase family enzyme
VFISTRHFKDAAMTDLAQRVRDFQALHVRGQPLVLFNIWDPGSAKAVAAAGARALATGSWSVAAAAGFRDGEQLPLDWAIDNLTRIVRSTKLPVTMDIESGYGKTAAEVGRTVKRTLEAGAVGCNLEDSWVENGKLRAVAEQVERIRAARAAADESGVAYFINARTDVFFQKPAEEHDQSMLTEALQRAEQYAKSGASGLFAPGLSNIDLIAKLASASPLPLNVMVNERTPSIADLAAAGVARVSHGPGPYLQAMRRLEELARQALGQP